MQANGFRTSDRVMTPDGPGIVLPSENGAADVVRVRLAHSADTHPGYCYAPRDVRSIIGQSVAGTHGRRVV